MTLTNQPVTFGGTLSVDLINGYNPAVGTQFKVVSGATATTGTFANLNLPTFANGDELVPVFNPGGLTLVVAAPNRPVQAQPRIPTASVNNFASFLGGTSASVSLTGIDTTVLGQTLTGNFQFGAGTTNTGHVAVVEASMSNATASLGQGLVNLTNGQGTVFFTPTGVVGSAAVSLAINAGPTASLSGNFGLALNTTGRRSTIPSRSAALPPRSMFPPYVRVSATGAQLTVVGQQVTGDFVLQTATDTENGQAVPVVQVGNRQLSWAAMAPACRCRAARVGSSLRQRAWPRSSVGRQPWSAAPRVGP